MAACSWIPSFGRASSASSRPGRQDRRNFRLNQHYLLRDKDNLYRGTREEEAE